MNNCLHIKLLDKCNLSCVYCYRKMIDKYCSIENEVEGNIFESILRDNSINNITFTGGELALYNGLDNLIDKFIKFNKNIDIFTNGINKLILNNIENINVNVSLDGNYDIMRKMRGVTKKQYVNILENIEYYIKNAHSVCIESLITNYSINFINLYSPYKIFGDRCNYVFNVPSLVYTDRKYCVYECDYDRIMDNLFEISEKMKFHFKYSINLYPIEYIINNIDSIVDMLLLIEFDSLTNTYNMFNYIFTNNYSNFYINKNFIKDKFRQLLEEYVYKYKYKYINPYNVIEKLVSKKEKVIL